MGARQPMGVRVLANCNMVNRIVLGWGAGQWQADAGTIVQPRRRPIAETGNRSETGSRIRAWGPKSGQWALGKWGPGFGESGQRWRGSTVLVELG